MIIIINILSSSISKGINDLCVATCACYSAIILIWFHLILVGSARILNNNIIH